MPAFYLEMRRAMAACQRLADSQADSDRDEAIDQLRALTARPDPTGKLDCLRVALGLLLAARAMSKQPGDTAELRDALDLLAVAKTSLTLTPKDRARALDQIAKASTLLTVIRAGEDLAHGRIPDIAELRAVRQAIDPAEVNSAAVLAIALGIALGSRSYANGSIEDRREAVDYLLEGLERLGPAQGDHPWHDFGLKFFAGHLGISGFNDSNAIPADRVLRLAEKGITESAERAEIAGLYHMIAYIAHRAILVQRDQPASESVTLEHLNKARELLAGDPKLSLALRALSGHFLVDRGKSSGSLEDQAAASALVADGWQTPAVKHWLEHWDQPDGVGQKLTMIHPATFDRFRALATTITASGLASVGDSGLVELSAIIDKLRHGIGGQVGLSPDTQLHRGMSQLAATLQAARGTRTGDLPAIDSAISELRASLPGPGQAAGPALWPRTMIGVLLRYRFVLTGDRRDLNNAIAFLAEARRGLGADTAALGAMALWQLAESYRLRNDPNRMDRQRSIEIGLEAQSERAAEVLMQSDTERGLEAARTSVLAATRLACWCLQDGSIDKAIQALEQGRALILHVTTLAPDLPGLLRSAGRDDLAQALVHQSGGFGTGQGDLAIPAGTRSEALEVLKTCLPDGDMLTPPRPAELVAGIAAAGYDALVYLISPEAQLPPEALLPPDLQLSLDLRLPPGVLIPGGRPRPDPALLGEGLALLVAATGMVDLVPLPDLNEEQVTSYDQAHLARIEDPQDQAARQRWQAALAGLCDWAWDAAMEPVLEHVARWRLGRQPRLVLVPTGKLGAVPWHAARTVPKDGRPHYAIEDALICYAASARQLATASRRQRRPPAERPVLISNPTGDLPLAKLEGRELRRQFYPHAEIFGDLGDDQVARPGTPKEILARLPGGTAGEASMLHFGCHADVGTSLAESRLLLAGRQPLTVAEIAAQAQGRDPRAPGFLAVLGACMTDLASTDHDEALTLASALLAVGASGVIGTRWPTSDLASAELLVMFHHYLNDGSAPAPAEALRSAQLWMLNPHRHAPDALAPRLARNATRADLAELPAWAGFTYQGA